MQSVHEYNHNNHNHNNHNIRPFHPAFVIWSKNWSLGMLGIFGSELNVLKINCWILDKDYLLVMDSQPE